MKFILSSNIWFKNLKNLDKPVTKNIGATTFSKVFSYPCPSPFNQCWWVWKLQQHHAVDKILTHSIVIEDKEGVLMKPSLGFLRENPNKLFDIELSNNCCGWL